MYSIGAKVSAGTRIRTQQVRVLTFTPILYIRPETSAYVLRKINTGLLKSAILGVSLDKV
jgi:hypothetical protein